MRRLNRRLIIILAGSILALGVGAFVVQRWQVNRHVDGLLRRADLAEEAGETGDAISLLDRYTQQKPDDAEAFTRLALLVEKRTRDRRIERNEFNSTWQLLEKAVRRQPENDELRRATIDYYLRFARFKDAAEHIQAQLRRDPNDAELQFKLARARIGGTEYGQAAELLESLVGYSKSSDDFDVQQASDAANIEAYQLLAAIALEHQGRPKFADRVIEQCVTANSKSAAALLVRGRYHLRQHREDSESVEQAKSDIRRAAELSPADPEVIATIAELETAEGNLAQAMVWLGRGMDLFPKRDTFYRQRAKLAIQQDDAGEALHIVNAGLRTNPDSWSLLLIQAELNLATGNLSSVEDTVTRLRSVEQMRLLGDYLNTRVLLAQEKWAACRDALQTLLPKLMNARPDLGPQAYLALAQCHEQLGQPDRQQQANRQLLELDPNSIAGHFSQSRAALRLGRLADAQQSLAKAQRIAKARGLVLDNLTNWETTLLAAEQRTRPKAQRDLTEVEKRFLKALDSSDELTATQKAATHVRFLIQQEEFDRASDVLDAALAVEPEDNALLLVRVDLTQLRDGSAAANELLGEMKTTLGDSVELRLREGILLASDAADDWKSRLRALEDDLDSFSTADKSRLWQGLGAIHRNMGNTKEALRLWQKVALVDPQDVTTRMKMFDLAREDGDTARMKSLSEEIAGTAGKDSAEAKFTEAVSLLVAAGGTPSATQLATVRRLATDAQSQRPNWHALSLLQAELNLREDNVDGAIEHLQQALQDGPLSPPTVRKLVELLGSQERIDEARAALTLLSQRGDMDLADVRLQSRAEFAGGQLRDAVALAQSAAEKSEDASDHLWLGRLLAAGEQPQSAAKAFRRAVELSPSDEQGRLELLRQLILADLRDEAEAEIGRMQAELPADRVISTIGVAYQLLGKRQLARQHFEKAIAERPSDATVWRDLAAFHLLGGDHEQTLVNLDRLLSLSETGATKQHFNWARRTKAKLLGDTGRYADFQTAVGLLAENRDGEVMSRDDLLVLAKLTLPRGDPYALQSALDEFKVARAHRTLTRAEQLSLGKIYEAAGDWQKCEEVMSSLVAGAEDNPTIIIAWCEMKLSHGDANGVEQLVRKLDQSEAATKQLRARLYAQQGRTERSVELIRAMIPPADDKQRIATVLALARLLEELELTDEAERFYRAAAKALPAAELNLADFLARNGKLNESLDIGDRLLNGSNVIAITRIGIMGLTTEGERLPHSSVQHARVASWLAQGRRTLPNSKAMLLNEVFFQELREEYDEAIELYQTYLQREDLLFHERAIAANNLAMIFASQGNCGEAQTYVDQAIQLVGPTVAMLDTRAMVALCRGDAASISQAIEMLELAAKTSQEPVIAFHLAIALNLGEQQERAEETLRDAMQKGLQPVQLSSWDRPRYEAMAKQFGIDRQGSGGIQSP